VVVLQEHSRGQLHHLARVGRAAHVSDALQLQLLHDPHLAHDVDLFVGRERDRLEVGGGGVGGGVYLLGGDVEPEGGKLVEVPGAALGGVVGHEDQLLALRAAAGGGREGGGAVSGQIGAWQG
jgi:hypothetical protein